MKFGLDTFFNIESIYKKQSTQLLSLGISSKNLEEEMSKIYNEYSKSHRIKGKDEAIQDLVNLYEEFLDKNVVPKIMDDQRLSFDDKEILKNTLMRTKRAVETHVRHEVQGTTSQYSKKTP